MSIVKIMSTGEFELGRVQVPQSVADRRPTVFPPLRHPGVDDRDRIQVVV